MASDEVRGAAFLLGKTMMANLSHPDMKPTCAAIGKLLRERDEALQNAVLFVTQRDEAREKAEWRKDLLDRIIKRLCPRYMDTGGEDEADRAIRVIDAITNERDEAREEAKTCRRVMVDKGNTIAELMDQEAELKALCREAADEVVKVPGLLALWKRLRKAGGDDADTQ